MSKGLGKKQQAIMGILQYKRAVYLQDILPQRFTRAEYVAMWRAALSLEKKGMIKIQRFCTGKDKNLITLPGVFIDRNEFIRGDLESNGISVD